MVNCFAVKHSNKTAFSEFSEQEHGSATLSLENVTFLSNIMNFLSYVFAGNQSAKFLYK